MTNTAKIVVGGSWKNVCPCCTPFKVKGEKNDRALVRRIARRIDREEVRKMVECELADWNEASDCDLTETEYSIMLAQEREQDLIEEFYDDLHNGHSMIDWETEYCWNVREGSCFDDVDYI